MKKEKVIKYPMMSPRNYENDIIMDKDGQEISTVFDYWRWAHSCIMENTERGAFAEYLVANAVGGLGEGRVNWSKYDLVSEEGITIEVKTSAYIQVWGQDKLSTINFGIKKTKGYIPEINEYEEEEKRQAQVYVFCHHTEKEQEKANPLDTRQWIFYVLSAKKINESERYSEAESISLNPLLKLGAIKCTYESLHRTIVEQAVY